jgi:dTDP-glucose pyrophosphorylase
MKELTLLVLAAGMGSRYGGLKQMDAFGPNGETIIDYSIYDAIEAGFSKIVFVIRESFKKEFVKQFTGKYGGKIQVEFVTQELSDTPIEVDMSSDREKPWGTAHAVWVAHNVIDGPFVVINGDDYYGKTAFKDVAKFFEMSSDSEFAVMGYYLKNTLSDHGTVNRGVCYTDNDENLTKVVECTKIQKDADGLIRYPDGDESIILDENTLVSMNLWAFTKLYFEATNKYFTNFLKERGSEEKSEFYIPDVIDDMISNKEVKVKVLPTNSNWFGVTYQEDKPFVIKELGKLIENGVYPENLWG